MRMGMAAAVAGMLAAGGASAAVVTNPSNTFTYGATSGPGYTWAAFDAPYSMFVELGDATGFNDLLENGAISFAFFLMVGSPSPSDSTYSEDGLLAFVNGGEIRSSQREVDGRTCVTEYTQDVYADLGFESGVLSYYAILPSGASDASFFEDDGSYCDPAPDLDLNIGPFAGEWAAVDGAPAFPYTATPSPVPLPASAWLLGATLTGLGLWGRKRRITP